MIVSHNVNLLVIKINLFFVRIINNIFTNLGMGKKIN